MPIVIKKKVDLGFLGEEYKDAYLIFQSIPLKDFDKIAEEIKAAEKDSKAATFMLDTLKKYYLEGKFPGTDKLEADDLDGLDAESVIKCFSTFTGQDPDPKVELPTPSSTAEAPPNS